MRKTKSLKAVDIGIVPRHDVNGPYSILTLRERFVAHDLAGDGTLLFVAEGCPDGARISVVELLEAK